jgi:DNA excision repair protein ERCC-1
VVLVSRSQNGNPLLRHVRCVRWAFADVLPDFVLGDNACAVFVSLRYHLLHPKYLATKIASLQRAFRLRAVLCLVDTEDVVKPLGEVNKIAAMGDCVLLCAFSPEEAARYVETLKAYEKKSPDAIKERRDADYVSRLAGALTAIRGVNKVDASSLGAQFGSLAGIMRADKATLAATPGLGPTKTKRLNEALHAPFRRRNPLEKPASLAAARETGG